ncbi:hypothetical protein FNF31_05077 [Cafeteria roenbergensis]|uniref:Major facilitator superfamily (MFS) profile domain-containing protein n=1 Tax=Cafeteria roenbergensis TaxID=33653 RepID=A0A5A8D2J4_CAFRO|nr:hypothetical protein FNF31_05077 [Cafeteria roenbergensis]
MANYRLAIIFFICINFCIYVDRGIVPGAFQQFDAMIERELGPDNVDTYFGALTSVFIIGYAVASFVVGQLVHLAPPFRIVGSGLLLWTASIVLAACAPSYWVLLVARGLSGVGEASFQCIIAPFIDDFAPQDSKALWIGAFYAAIPVGSALGYIYGADVASASPLSWRAPFVAEAPVLLLLAVAVFFVNVPPPKGMQGAKLVPQATAQVSGGDVDGAPHADATPAPSADPSADPSAAPSAPAKDVSLAVGLCRVLRNRVFMLVALGYAAYNYSLAGFGAFAPKFLVALRLLKDESEASTIFGAVLCVSGFVGTLLGGYATDKAIAWVVRRAAAADAAAAGAAGAGSGRSAGRAGRGRSGGGRASLAGGASGAPLLRAGAGPSAGGTRPAPRGTEGRRSFGGETAGGGGGYAHDVVHAADPDTALASIAPPSPGPAHPAGETAAAASYRRSGELVGILIVSAVSMTTGAALAVSIAFATGSLAAYLGVTAAACLLLFTSNGSAPLAMMTAVSPEDRALAMGVGQVIQHALGDVPAPTIIGLILDSVAPKTAHGRSREGLELTILAIMGWLGWAVLFWLASLAVGWRFHFGRDAPQGEEDAHPATATAAEAGAGPLGAPETARLLTTDRV